MAEDSVADMVRVEKGSDLAAAAAGVSYTPVSNDQKLVGWFTDPSADSDDLSGQVVSDIEDEDVPLASAIGLNDQDHFAYIMGYEDDTVRPLDNITRAEAVTVINRMLNRLTGKEHMTASMKVWIDNPEGTWYYEAIQEASNEHAYERDDEETEIWTGLLPATNWKALEEQWAAENAPAETAETDADAAGHKPDDREEYTMEQTL